MRKQNNFRIIICLLILIIGKSIYSQESPHSLMINSRLHYGWIIAHHRELKDVSQTNPWGLEVDLAWQLMSKNSWQYCYCYPKVGLSFSYINFDNPNVLGSSFGLYGFVEPVIGAENNLSGFMRFGIGPNYLNQVYDSITNPENEFYSSPISFIVALGLGFNYRINERTEFRFAANLNHISNGGLKKPNKGINFPTLSAGIDYKIRSRPYQQHPRSDTVDLTPYYRWLDVEFFATGKTAVKGHERYLVTGFNLNYHWVIGRLSAISTGAEWCWDLADKALINKNNVQENGELVDYKYGALLVGHDLLLGRFTFSFLLGGYVYSPFSRKNLVYQRYDISYRFSKRMFFGIDLKAHGHVADFLDFRLGYSLYR